MNLSLKSIERIFAEINQQFNPNFNITQYYNQRIRLIALLIANENLNFQPKTEMRYINDLNLRLNQTLALVSSGLSNSGIGELLNINSKTVESRLSQLFDHFNIDTKGELSENPRVLLFVSAYCRGHSNKNKIKKLFKETSGINLEEILKDPNSFLNDLDYEHKTIG